MISIVLYTLPGCPACIEIKKGLEEKGIKYEERDALTHINELISRNLTSVPVISINGDFYLVRSMDEVLFLLRKYNWNEGKSS